MDPGCVMRKGGKWSAGPLMDSVWGSQGFPICSSRENRTTGICMEGMPGGLAWERKDQGTQCRRVSFELLSPQMSIKAAVYMTLAFRERWEEFLGLVL